MLMSPGPLSVSYWVNASNRARPQRYVIFGMTRNSAGAALGNCAVEVFETASMLFRGSTISDASGNFSIDVTANGLGLTFQVVCYKAGGTGDVEGCSVNTLVGTPS